MNNPLVIRTPEKNKHPPHEAPCCYGLCGFNKKQNRLFFVVCLLYIFLINTGLSLASEIMQFVSDGCAYITGSGNTSGHHAGIELQLTGCRSAIELNVVSVARSRINF